MAITIVFLHGPVSLITCACTVKERLSDACVSSIGCNIFVFFPHFLFSQQDEESPKPKKKSKVHRKTKTEEYSSL